MFARSPCSLSSFLIVFIWFGGGVRQRDCGRSRFVGGLAAALAPRSCSSATRPPNPDDNPDRGQLTILAIEPAAGARQSGGTSGSKTAALREFAFSTIPLKTIPPGPAPHREPTS